MLYFKMQLKAQRNIYVKYYKVILFDTVLICQNFSLPAKAK